MSIATLAQNQAQAVIRRYGATATLTHSVMGTYNTSSGVSTPTLSTSTIKVIRDGSSMRTLGARFGEDIVLAGDEQVTIAAKSATPVLGDTLTMGSVTYQVAAVRPLYVMDAVATWECLVRR